MGDKTFETDNVEVDAFGTDGVESDGTDNEATEAEQSAGVVHTEYGGEALCERDGAGDGVFRCCFFYENKTLKKMPPFIKNHSEVFGISVI
jgi:hypothetical protein